jgi:hypothetical protein
MAIARRLHFNPTSVLDPDVQDGSHPEGYGQVDWPLERMSESRWAALTSGEQSLIPEERRPDSLKGETRIVSSGAKLFHIHDLIYNPSIRDSAIGQFRRDNVYPFSSQWDEVVTESRGRETKSDKLLLESMDYDPVALRNPLRSISPRKRRARPSSGGRTPVSSVMPISNPVLERLSQESSGGLLGEGSRTLLEVYTSFSEKPVPSLVPVSSPVSIGSSPNNSTVGQWLPCGVLSERDDSEDGQEELRVQDQKRRDLQRVVKMLQFTESEATFETLLFDACYALHEEDDDEMTPTAVKGSLQITGDAPSVSLVVQRWTAGGRFSGSCRMLQAADVKFNL